IVLARPVTIQGAGPGFQEGQGSMRKFALSLILLAVMATQSPAQSGWAEKMFDRKVVHDFGSVPRGAQLFHRFPITNIYAVRMEIISVQSGCGCVSAEAT